MGSSGGTGGKESACYAGDVEMWVWFLGREDSLEEGMAAYSSILAWRIPWTEELVGSMMLQRVGHDWSNVVHIWALGRNQCNNFLVQRYAESCSYRHGFKLAFQVDETVY